MEKHQEAREKAERCLKIADHMLSVTYPLLKDTKLLVPVLENLFLSLTSSIDSVLYYERLYKRVPPFNETLESKLAIYTQKIAPKHRVDPRYIQTLQRVWELVKRRRQSPVEFTRRDKYIICTGDYQMAALTIEQLKGYVQTAKEFIKLNDRIIAQNEKLS